MDFICIYNAITGLQNLIYYDIKRQIYVINRLQTKVIVMNIKNLLGEKVKRLRKMRGFTQEQFAEIIDITPRNLCRIESGENFVTAETLDKILNALNIPADILFTYEHLKEDKELLADIYTYIDKIKSNQKQLEKTYRILRLMAEDEF